jgi:RNA polymerase primary sigma factor
MGHLGSSVDWILQQSHRFPLLTAEDEIMLARQVQAWQALADVKSPSKRQKAIITKGRRARDRFFLSNIRLAVNVAGRYQKFGGTLTLEDLIQEGLIGLDSAITKFDPALGYKFSTYSYWWIRQGITRSINKYSRVIHLPTAANDSIRKAVDFMQEHSRKHGRLPAVEKVAEVCNVGTKTLLGYLNHNANVISLDQPMLSSSDHGSFMDLVADTSDQDRSTGELDLIGEMVLDAVSSLPETYQRVVKERYLNGKNVPTPYQVIGEELHISRESARKMHDHALNRLRLTLGGLTGQECIQALQSAA